MPAKRIPQLDSLSSSGAASNDQLVIFDTDADVTKRIDRSALFAASAGSSLVGHLPAGTIAATTVQGALNELDTEKQPANAGLTDIAGLTKTDGNIIVGDGTNWVAESGATARTSLGLSIGVDVQEYDADTAKTDVAQTFTAQQTLTSGLVLQSVAAADIAAVANVINTANKVLGKVVYDTTNNRLMVANGAAAADPWYVADGSASVVPA